MLRNSFLASLMISIGGLIFLSCENKYIGAFLFSIALFVICVFKLNLFTGKIGFLGEKFEIKSFLNVLLILLYNLIFCICLGVIFRFGFQNLLEKVSIVAVNKLSISYISVLIRSILCGIIMYLAVKIFSDHRNSLGIFIGIPVFILAGFEHSIANTFYLSLSGDIFTLHGVIFILINIIGNSIGSILFAKILKK